MRKLWWKSKTIIVGALIAAAGTSLEVLDAVGAIDITPLLPPQRSAMIIAGIGVLKILLWLVTTGAVGKAE